MILNDNIEAAAERLRAAEVGKRTCAPVRDLIGVESLEAAYAVQKINTNHRIASGGRIIGHKIGLTAPVVQKQLGVDQPDFGLLWHDKEILNGGEISVSELMQPKAEAEIAFVLGKDLNADFITSVDVLNAVDYALASIEVVGSRISNWDIKITDTIADNASASHWVVGHQPVKLQDLDLVNCGMSMENNFKVVSEGIGSACLGSPINALLWLARKMVLMGEPLKAGDLILSGAIGPMVNVVAGDHFNVTIEGLGSVSASFVA
jgi:2-keto-4-pentenoate hydratase